LFKGPVVVGTRKIQRTTTPSSEEIFWDFSSTAEENSNFGVLIWRWTVFRLSRGHFTAIVVDKLFKLFDHELASFWKGMSLRRNLSKTVLEL